MLQVNVTGNCGHEVSEGETDRLENAYNGFEEHRRHFLKEFSAAAVRRMLGMFEGVEWVARCSQGEKCSANSPLHHICLTTLLLCTTFFFLSCY